MKRSEGCGRSGLDRIGKALLGRKIGGAEQRKSIDKQGLLGRGTAY
jgi:hypothetical protein